MMPDMLKKAVSLAIPLKLDVLLECDVTRSLDGLPMMVARRHPPMYRLVVVLLAEVVMSVVMFVAVDVVVMSVVVKVAVVAVVWSAVLVTGVTVVVVGLAAVRCSEYHYWIHYLLLHHCLHCLYPLFVEQVFVHLLLPLY